MKLLRTLLIAAALGTTPALAVTYTVKAGDTLSKIAQRYGTEAAQLMRLNGLRSTTIEIGQKLNLGNVKAPAAGKAPTVTAAPRNTAYVRATASRFLGIRYALGGTGGRGIDCSAFTGLVFKQLGINLPRTAAAQWRTGYAVSSRNLQPGDLVFFNTTGRVASHVGIYVGDGLMANANSYQGRTVIEPLFGNPYWAQRYVGARRVLS